MLLIEHLSSTSKYDGRSYSGSSRYCAIGRARLESHQRPPVILYSHHKGEITLWPAEPSLKRRRVSGVKKGKGGRLEMRPRY